MFRLLLGGSNVFFLPVGQLPPPPGVYAQEGGHDRMSARGKAEHQTVVEWPYNFGSYCPHPQQTTDWRARSHHIADRRRFT